MAADKEECGLHPKRPATMGQKYFQLREVDGDIVDVNRIAVLVPCSGENRRPSVKHDRNTVSFGCTVDNFQFLRTGQVVVRKQQLVRRMDLDHLQTQSQYVLDISEDVGRVPWMQAATR